MSQAIGFTAEDLALGYLKQQGLTYITRNYQSRFGEIDLIMRDKHHLIFIEVRKRSSRLFGGAASSISLNKRQKIIKTALAYLSKYNLHHQQAIRFDVVCMDGVPARFTWIKNAFGADY
ncbi:YraN family protein [Legionella londiniensis]|uniref:UPF0102 protein Llon_2127 n=1 Tax=Legionella londiniensis TaxID=45068 RepID=A0A0W0VHR3_9GAMM|nr:YraN family protein [Legionella londiniensis]KTD19547.1 hypothetical protein Llon_2127 [Legionella londiniensis]STX92232.1 putative endonuclease distantly related to archaeal Holliday junction resolvase [Legionella londiniensis]